jgi:hypothetical protein
MEVPSICNVCKEYVKYKKNHLQYLVKVLDALEFKGRIQEKEIEDSYYVYYEILSPIHLYVCWNNIEKKYMCGYDHLDIYDHDKYTNIEDIILSCISRKTGHLDKLIEFITKCFIHGNNGIEREKEFLVIMAKWKDNTKDNDFIDKIINVVIESKFFHIREFNSEYFGGLIELRINIYPICTKRHMKTFIKSSNIMSDSDDEIIFTNDKTFNLTIKKNNIWY